MSQLTRIHETARREGGISRRTLLGWGAALAALPALNGRTALAVARAFRFAGDPFTLGVASGDPTDSGVVLWTKLAPKPLEAGGGMPANAAVEVAWEVASDEAMTRVVRRGTAVATPALGHSVHVEAEGLEADRWYWYRFRAGDATSRVGRARTLPAAASDPDRLRFAFASCSHFEQGHFTAYGHMAKEEVDLIFHLGDYIYEGSGERIARDGARPDTRVRKHLGREIMTLDDYRIRHAQYKTDPDLQAAHARCPWFVTWDDHEVDNNYADAIAEEARNGEARPEPADFLLRRANAYQAYYEMMPLRPASLPRGPKMQLFRGASFGRLAELLVLDTRQHRTDQPNGDKRAPINEAATAREGTILGAEQKGWLESRLIASPATWNVMAQQVMMGMVNLAPEGEAQYSMDQWPGYTHERVELGQFLQDRRVLNPVVLTGDIHTNWVNDLRVDDRKPETTPVASEFVVTSITSGGNGSDAADRREKVMAGNPGVRYFNSQRGYVRCTVTPDRWQSDYMVVDQVTEPNSPIKQTASFTVEAGRPGVQTT